MQELIIKYLRKIWRGKNIIKRNAIIRLHNEGRDIKKYKGDSPYLNDYIERLNK